MDRSLHLLMNDEHERWEMLILNETGCQENLVSTRPAHRVHIVLVILDVHQIRFPITRAVNLLT